MGLENVKNGVNSAEVPHHVQVWECPPGMSVAISPSVCTLLSNGPFGRCSCESFMQFNCTIQNKHWLISIDLTINSCREFEFTVKTMNTLLSESFTHH